MNNFLLSEEITSAFPNLLGNCSWVLGQCMASKLLYLFKQFENKTYLVVKEFSGY
jgi:hypothetical protein